MSKVITLAVAVLLVAVPAFAQIIVIVPTTGSGLFQTQNFIAGVGNGIILGGGQQQLSSSNFATIVNNQFALGQCDLSASEHQIAFFNQNANAIGMSADLIVTQAIGILPNSPVVGVQVQNIGEGVDPKLQQQALGLGAIQQITKVNSGLGDASANQTMSVLQDQNSTNATGPMDQSSFVFGQQVTNLTSAPGAQGQAGSTLAVSTGQTQVVY